MTRFPAGTSLAGVALGAPNGNFAVESTIFLIALGQAAEIQLIGRLYLAEVALAFLLPYLLVLRAGQALPPLVLPLLLAWAAWLGAQLISDVINDSAMPDRLRGIAKIMFVAIDILAPLLLVNGHPRRIIGFGLGLSIGTSVTVILDSELAVSFENIWKFALGRSVIWTITLVVPLLLLPRMRPSLVLAGLVAATGCVSVVLGSRSLGLFALTTAGCLVLQRFSAGRDVGTAGLSMWAFLAAPVTALFIAASTWGVYEAAANSGWLSDTQMVKRELQSSGQFGTLVGSRPELLVAWQAIVDAPLFGHGSWARDQAYADQRVWLLYQLGYQETFAPSTDDLIPAHSLIFGAWIEAGVVGAFFWTNVFIVALRALWQLYRTPTWLGAYSFFVVVWLVWDCLFSPIGASSRLPTCWSIAVALMVMASARRQRSTRLAPRSLAQRLHRHDAG